MSKQYDFEFVVDEAFYKAYQKKQTVMLVTESDTFIVYMEGYVPLGKGQFKLYGSHPPPGKENYKTVIRMRT